MNYLHLLKCTAVKITPTNITTHREKSHVIWKDWYIVVSSY